MERLRVAFAAGVMPDKWKRAWAEKNPRIRLELAPVEAGAGRELLDTDEADMVLVRLPVDLNSPTALHCVRLYDEQPVAVASRDHWLAAADEGQEVPIDDLADDLLELGEAVTAEDAMSLAANGSGVVVLPMSLARLHQRKDTVQRPVSGPEPTTVALLWLRDKDNDVLQDFVGVSRGRRVGSSR